MHSMGFPSVKDLKWMISHNSIMNCPDTLQDVDLATKIFGPDVASIKGKTTHLKPPPVRSHTVAVPPELLTAQQDVDLCFDTMYVNKIPFLTHVSKRIIYRGAERSIFLIPRCQPMRRLFTRSSGSTTPGIFLSEPCSLTGSSFQLQPSWKPLMVS